MKGKRALAFDFPEELSRRSRRYLITIHPMLYVGPQAMPRYGRACKGTNHT